MQRLLIALLLLAPIAAAQTTRDNAWRADLDVLATNLPRLHPNLFYATPRAEFDRAVAALSEEIGSLSDVAVMTRMAAIVALPRDGHTSLWLTQKPALYRRIPLRFQWFDDGLFVTGASAEYSRAAGAKVLRVGRNTAEEAYDALQRIISHENDIYARGHASDYLPLADVLQALGISASIETVPFEFQDSSGLAFQMEVKTGARGESETIEAVPGASSGFRPLYLQNREQNYWFTYIESSRTLYFAYNSCQEMPGHPFARFNDELWATFDSKQVDRLIIDLRHNEGGSSSVIEPFLLSGLARQSKLDTVHGAIIIGRHTFSSGIMAAFAMHGGPVLAFGEPTGASTTHYGNVATLILPNSQLRIGYSTKYFVYPVPPGPMIPDVPVANTATDYFARHDAFLAAVLADARTASSAAGTMAVVNAASFRGPAAPAGVAAAFGDWQDPAGVALEVTVNGAAAQVIAGVRGQVNFVVPADATPGMALIRIGQAGFTLAEGWATIAEDAPGLFFAAQHDGVLEIYGTGFGRSPAPRVYVGSEQAEILWSGPHPALPGVWQVNARTPAPVAPGLAPVFVTGGAAASNGVTVRIEK